TQDAMRRTACLFLAAASLIAATRPHYGGTLRMRAHPLSLEPAAANDLVPQVFDTLVTFSETGRPEPSLATSWRHDADFKRWEFQIRTGVRFHDGALLTPESVAKALESVQAVAQEGAVIIRSQVSGSNLLYALAGLPVFK